MKKTFKERAAEMELDTLKRQYAIHNFCNAYAALATAKRQTVNHIVERLLYRKTASDASGSYSYLDRWTIDDLWEVDLQLRSVSPKTAHCWRRWAFAHLKKGLNTRLALLWLADSIDGREESLADFPG